MKRFSIAFLSIIIGLYSTAVGAAETVRTPDALRVKTFTLDNGMEVWINEDHTSPNAYGAVQVKAGAMDCAGTGIAHYFEHMMFKGTSRIGTVDYAAEKPLLDSIAVLYDKLALTEGAEARTAIQMEINRLSIAASRYAIPNEFDALTTQTGSSNLNAFTSYDETVYHSDFIPAYFEQWAQINAERIADPVFRLFQSELETVYEEKNMGEDSPMGLLYEKLMERFFKGTPYEKSVIGTTANLKNPQLGKMAEFFQKYYSAGNMCLVICGNVDADEIMPIIRRTFGAIRSGEPAEHPEVSPEPFHGREQIEYAADIPLIRLSALCYRTPGKADPDRIKLDLLSHMMNNQDGTGLLDRLVVEHKLMGAQFMVQSMNAAGMGILMVIPKLIGQSSDAAEKLALSAFSDIKAGRIDEGFLQSCKLSYKKAALLALENLEDRIYEMVDVASSGRSWDEHIAELESVDGITAQDIADVARRYIGDDCLHAVKKTGKSEREHLAKPPYEKVVPESKDSVSAYAKSVREAVKGIVPELRDVDYDSSLSTLKLSDNVTLFASPNPMNDIFSLEYRFLAGKVEYPALERVESYLPMLGLSDMSYDEFNGELQKLGGGLSIESGDDSFSVTIAGFDDRFEETVSLASRILTDAKGDRKKLSSVKSDEKASLAMGRKDLSRLGAGVMFKVAYGDRSPYLADKGEFSDKALNKVLREVCRHSCNVIYSGSSSVDQVGDVVARSFDLASVDKAVDMLEERPVMEYNTGAVYFVDVPDAAQAMIFAYIPIGKLGDLDSRELALLYNSYLGGGMTSLMFQEIREFRSMAYSTSSQLARPAWSRRNDRDCFIIANVSTQCDKAIDAMTVVDSLVMHTPFLEGKIADKKKERLNDLVNMYPGFREVGGYVSDLKSYGYEKDIRTHNARIVSDAGIGDLEAFHKEYVASRPVIWCIAGSKARMDMQALAGFGTVTELKPSDVIR